MTALLNRSSGKGVLPAKWEAAEFFGIKNSEKPERTRTYPPCKLNLGVAAENYEQ